jgi:uncharacterized membrane protein YfhO
VPVEAGRHRVEVYYDPPLFKVGLAITILTLLASGALLGIRIKYLSENC